MLSRLHRMLRLQKLYPTWGAACAAAGSYSDELVNRFRVERAQPYVCPPALALILQPGMSVTDFGGGVALNSPHTIVENKTLVGMMGKPNYTTEIPDSCDVFFTSGTLQYLPDPGEIIEAAFRTARYGVAFLRNSFCETELFRVQKSWLFDNGSGLTPHGYRNIKITYPHRTIREIAIMETASKYGFRCVSRLEEQSGVLPYGDIVYGKQLLFLSGEPQP